MPLLSVIIPIFNVEKFLNQCINSIIIQNLNELELILVDDGSSDSSSSICEEYCCNYKFIKVLHKHNRGASSARNIGLKAAIGQYVMFMDSDDWWNSEINVAKMLDAFYINQNLEMLLFTSYDYIERQGFFQRNEHKNFKNLDTTSVKNFYRSLLNNGNMEVSADTKILRRSFLIDNGLYFDENLICEDNEWMIRLLRSASNIEIKDVPLYLCRCGRTTSVTNNIKKKNITDMLDIVHECISYNSNTVSDIKYEELCFASYLWFCALGLANRLNKEELKEVKPLFQDTSSVNAYGRSKKTKLSNAVYRIFGFNMTVKILGLYLKIKKNDTAKTKVSERIGNK